jgi:hypothetical protein
LNGTEVPLSLVTLPISIRLWLAGSRGAGGPYTLSSSRLAVRRFLRSSRIWASGRGARPGASSLAVVKELVSKVMSWSTNWPK